MAVQTRLFIGNLPENTIENDLFMAFSTFGEITNLDIKNKSEKKNELGKENKIFAFVTLSATNYDIESCIKHFTTTNFNGNKIYVTRARESFLERLQRERAEAQKETTQEKPSKHHKKHNLNLDHLNPKKRKVDQTISHDVSKKKGLTNLKQKSLEKSFPAEIGDNIETAQVDKKKKDSDAKRMESMKKKRQEFKEKKKIIKTGLGAIDKIPNKKIIFSDDDVDIKNEGKNIVRNGNSIEQKKKGLFDDEDESDNEVNFEVKKQFEGKQGQKVLELQSRYKSDKRFVLDERFIENEGEKETEDDPSSDSEGIEIATQDEKTKQMNILQDVLGVTIKTHSEASNNKKPRSKFGMLRFDPSQPEHAKLLAPIEETPQEPMKKKRKIKDIQIEEPPTVETTIEENKFPVSKDQFYKVSETLKEAIVQPNSFSLRSLFGQSYEDSPKDDLEQDTGYIPLEVKKPSKNPLDIGSKNPFEYDSSDSEDEKEELPKPEKQEVRAVWKENFFFTESDVRISDGLAFFNTSNKEDHKERRELKSLMKKRIYNKDRKNQMFQKKIGGRKKSFKKSYRPK